MALVIVFVLSTLSFNFNVLLPVLAAQTLAADAGVFGLVTAMFGAGSLVGALLAASLGLASWTVLLGRRFRVRGGSSSRSRPSTTPPPQPCSSSSPEPCFTLWTSAANATVQLSDAGSAAGPRDRVILRVPRVLARREACWPDGSLFVVQPSLAFAVGAC